MEDVGSDGQTLSPSTTAADPRGPGDRAGESPEATPLAQRLVIARLRRPPQRQPSGATTGAGLRRVLLFNDQANAHSHVVVLLILATGFDFEECPRITEEAHVAGRSEVTRTGEAEAAHIVEIPRAGGLIAAVRHAWGSKIRSPAPSRLDGSSAREDD